MHAWKVGLSQEWVKDRSWMEVLKGAQGVNGKEKILRREWGARGLDLKQTVNMN